MSTVKDVKLYTNSTGKEIRRHSYSSGLDFERCPRLFKLKRIDGWQSRIRRASLEFGTAIESAIQSFHVDGADIVAAFEDKWVKMKEEDLDYSAKEDSWQTLNSIGKQMVSLYSIRVKSWPIINPLFQMQFKKEVFPGTEYAGIEDVSYIDMLIMEPEPLLIDIKTSSTSVPGESLLCLDPQLRHYAWISGILNVGFLWFQKDSLSPRKGDEVSLLRAAGPFQPGDVARVLEGGKTETLIIPPGNYSDYEDETKNLTDTNLSAKASTSIKHRYANQFGLMVPSDAITKQKVSFVQARLDEEDAQEAGEEIGRQIVEIVQADRTGKYPKRPGVRFPDNKCLTCEMLAICTKNIKKRDETLIQINSSPARSWIDELEEEGE